MCGPFEVSHCVQSPVSHSLSLYVAGLSAVVVVQVFLVRKVVGPDTGKMYAMKVLKKATLKGEEGEGEGELLVIYSCCL